MPPLLRSAVDGVLISEHDHNLVFQTLKGDINAEVWIIHDESGRSKRASLTFLNQSGSVRTKVVRFTSPFQQRVVGGKCDSKALLE
jgi:hypothetical protein